MRLMCTLCADRFNVWKRSMKGDRDGCAYGRSTQIGKWSSAMHKTARVERWRWREQQPGEESEEERKKGSQCVRCIGMVLTIGGTLGVVVCKMTNCCEASKRAKR